MFVKRINTTELRQAVYKGNCPVFSTPEWVKLYEKNGYIIGVFDDAEKLCGYCYFISGKKKNLPFLINAPYSPNCGLVYLNPAKNKAKQLSFDKKVLAKIADHIAEHGFRFVDFSLPVSIIDTQPFFWKKFAVHTRYTYRLSLTGSIEEIYAGLSSERRKSLKRAEKDGLTTGLCSDLKEVKTILSSTYSRKQKEFKGELIDKILFTYSNAANSFAFVTRSGGKAIACSFCVYDNDCCYYLLGGYEQEQKHHGALTSCIWESIRLAKEKGIITFDFEGSMLQEVERFFREFGGEITPYYTIKKSWLPVRLLYN